MLAPVVGIFELCKVKLFTHLSGLLFGEIPYARVHNNINFVVISFCAFLEILVLSTVRKVYSLYCVLLI